MPAARRDRRPCGTSGPADNRAAPAERPSTRERTPAFPPCAWRCRIQGLSWAVFRSSRLFRQVVQTLLEFCPLDRELEIQDLLALARLQRLEHGASTGLPEVRPQHDECERGRRRPAGGGHNVEILPPWPGGFLGQEGSNPDRQP